MWTYNSKTGELLHPDGTSFGFGFSGNGRGINQPAYDGVHDLGPIPKGKYKMTQWIDKDPHLGLCVIVLEKVDVAVDRDGFRIHGPRNLFTRGLDAFLHSSNGCICIGDCTTRKVIWGFADHDLEVTY